MTVIAALYFLGSVMFLVVSVFAAGILVLISLFSIVVSIGMFRGWKWVWYLSVVLWVISIVVDGSIAVGVALSSLPLIVVAIIPGLITAICLRYFFQDHVKIHFGVEQALSSTPLPPPPQIHERLCQSIRFDVPSADGKTSQVTVSAAIAGSH
ncbi:hypothetical protein A3K79_05635 [Candidatus Bathyarchaeota archaeon RBG_13_46_16b]|nr:MAG: hypothetical protein A3K79_05635 [Candidatus Bathyarchaeota archaeon RBG_13_46_16b]